MIYRLPWPSITDRSTLSARGMVCSVLSGFFLHADLDRGGILLWTVCELALQILSHEINGCHGWLCPNTGKKLKWILILQRQHIWFYVELTFETLVMREPLQYMYIYIFFPPRYRLECSYSLVIVVSGHLTQGFSEKPELVPLRLNSSKKSSHDPPWFLKAVLWTYRPIRIWF